MSTSNLTAKYRPQTFGQVAGQDSVKTILSRAAESGSVAPAYLFSGTRGVGKTTIARIFAKALNCEKGPAGEPCNECVHCRQITAGSDVDVVEIDAASNRGIEYARKLKEDIGYAPLSSRYKVFIIDEAHMLTREAFNALLKTLEEPPPHATFIMATTEPHKFPATIISRSQHYVYKRLTEAELAAHLANILEQESMEYDPGALKIIARRGAGSVRDSMSLLGQVLALGGERLSEEDARSVLGLAGQDVFLSLMAAIAEKDLAALTSVLDQVLDQGLDLGFFLRELAACWRNMFLLGQVGVEGAELLGLSQDEAQVWQGWIDKFSRPQIHACWQMTLEGQRRVLGSLEPAQALELLLLNLAYLPELVDLGKIGTAPTGEPPMPTPTQGGMRGAGAPPAGRGNRPPMRNAGPQANPGGGYAQSPPPTTAPPMEEPPAYMSEPPGAQHGDTAPASRPVPTPKPSKKFASGKPLPTPPPMPEALARATGTKPAAPAASPRPTPAPSPAPRPTPAPSPTPAPTPAPTAPPAPQAAPDPEAEPPASSGLPAPPDSGDRDWFSFKRWITGTGKRMTDLDRATGEVSGSELVIRCQNEVNCNRLKSEKNFKILDEMVRTFFGPDTQIRFEYPEPEKLKTLDQLTAEARQHPAVSMFMDAFSAGIEDVNQTGRNKK